MGLKSIALMDCEYQCVKNEIKTEMFVKLNKFVVEFSSTIHGMLCLGASDIYIFPIQMDSN